MMRSDASDGGLLRRRSWIHC